MSLSKKLFFVSAFFLVVLTTMSFAVLYRAQSHQALSEMDTILENQLFSLSALVSTKSNGQFDFEISPSFLTQYQHQRSSAFFRFVEKRTGYVLQESHGAPSVECKDDYKNGSDLELSGERLLRVKSYVFHPEIENESKSIPTVGGANICLVVGIDEAPYKLIVVETVLSTIPLLVGLVLFLIGALLILVRRMTRDLSKLTRALETIDFGATHEFPTLPTAHTPEVRAVVEKLESLHLQAAKVYQEMWLFLGRAAHQLKTPVAAMQATLQVLLRKERSKEELLSGLKDVESASALLEGLTRKLISSSRIAYQSSPDREEIELSTFLSEQIKLFHAQAERRGIILQFSPTAKIDVIANTFLLSEIFGNLIENAIFYSPHDCGAIVSISIQKQESEVEISISDQGKGFPPQVKASLFEAFIRGDERVVAGSGLGLSNARKAAQLLGGDIELRKSDALGSKIMVVLICC